MMAVTHAAIATAGVSLLLGTSDPLPLGLAVLGSQLPDLDTTTSIIGQVLYPVSSWRTETLNFTDENPTERLQQIAIANAGKRVYLSGALTVDYPEGVTLQPSGRQHQTAVLSGETLTLELHLLELATVQLSDQWVMGSLRVEAVPDAYTLNT